MISSTYTKRAVKEEFVTRVNNEWLDWEELDLKETKAEDNFENHCLEAWRKPYKDFVICKPDAPPFHQN